jgi:sulfite reductase alpha subunit-like flavoprotein
MVLEGTHSGDIPPLLTVGELFYQYIDLCGPPTKKFLRDLPFYAIEEEDKNKLLALLDKDDKILSAYLADRTYYEMFEDFPSVTLPMSILISIIPLIQPRVYAVASSPKQDPSRLDLIVRHERYTTPSGRIRNGLCSSHLLSLHTMSMIDSHFPLQISCFSTFPLFHFSLSTLFVLFSLFTSVCLLVWLGINY